MAKNLWGKYKDLFIYQFAIGYNAVVNLLGIILFTRFISTEELGFYFYFIAFVNFLSIFGAFGFQQGILRFNPGRNSLKEINLLFNYSLSLTFVLSVLLFLVLIFVEYGALDLDRKFILILYFGVIVDSIYKILLSFYQSHKMVNNYKLATIISNTLKWFFGFIFVISFDMKLNGLIYSFIIGELFCLIIFVFKFNASIAFTLNYYVFKKILFYLKYGAPLMGYSLITYFKPLLINHYIKINEGNAAIGIFNANFIMGLNVIGLLTTPLLLYIQPIMVEKYYNDKKEFYSTFSLFTKLFLFSSVLTLLVYMVLQRDVINILIGPDFRSGGMLILLGVFSAVLNGLILILIKPIEMRKDSFLILKINIISFLFFLISGFFMYNLFSINGVAYAYIGSNLLTSIYLYISFSYAFDNRSGVILDLIVLVFLCLFSILINSYFQLGASLWLMKISALIFICIYLILNLEYCKSICRQLRKS